jgi:hypothetical protein
MRVPVGHRVVGEPERGRGGHDHRVAMRHERMVVGIAGRPATARRRYRPPNSSAFADQTSATGLEPWYGGRSSDESTPTSASAPEHEPALGQIGQLRLEHAEVPAQERVDRPA